MKSLQVQLTEYVAARRALGTTLEEPAQTLRHFVRFLARKKARFITIPLALEWSQESRGVQRATWARKLSMVRQFARWLSVSEPCHQVPPPRLLDVRHRRGKPHIYSVSVRRSTWFPRCADYGQSLGCYLLKAASNDDGGAVRTKSMSWSGSSLNLA